MSELAVGARQMDLECEAFPGEGEALRRGIGAAAARVLAQLTTAARILLESAR